MLVDAVIDYDMSAYAIMATYAEHAVIKNVRRA